jgi:hypothetical protein
MAPQRFSSQPPRRPLHVITWPSVGSMDEVSAVQWRVWLGHQLAQWRKRGDQGRPMMQKKAAARSGLTADVISRIESGHRGCDVVELHALAQTYGKTAPEIGDLFVLPSDAEWADICRRRQPVATNEARTAEDAGAIDVRLQATPRLMPFDTSA